MEDSLITLDRLDYWKKRCEAAEVFAKSQGMLIAKADSGCDSDEYFLLKKDMIEMFTKWQAIVKEEEDLI